MKKIGFKILIFLIRCLPSRVNAGLILFVEGLAGVMYNKRAGEVFMERNNIDGNIKMLLDVTEKTQRRLFLNKIYESRETEYMSGHLSEGDVFVDIGANVGYFSLIAAKHVGKKGRVFAFEPAPSNFDKLLYNVKLNNFDNIDCYPFAVYDKESSMPLFLNSLNEGGNSLVEFDGNAGQIQIEAVTLDNFIARHYPSLVIKLIKIDVEGAELNVVRGMRNILKAKSAPEIICEVLSNSYREISFYLSEYGYKGYLLTDKGPVAFNEKSQIDAVENILFSKQH